MKNVDSDPQGKSPFVVGRRYRVLRSFQALRDNFEAGEELIFEQEAYSRYDNCTGYFFSQPGVDGLRAWDIGDDEDVEIWKELFEEITN